MKLRDLPKSATVAETIDAVIEWLDEKLALDDVSEGVRARSSLARTRYAALTELRDELVAHKAKP